MRRREKNPRSQQKLVLVIAGGIVAAVLGISAVLMMQESTSEHYIKQLQEISDQSRTITQNYEDSITKWKDGSIDNAQMLQITDKNLEQLQLQMSRMKALEPPEKFKEGHEISILSLEYELQSNEHMRKYVETGDQEEYKKSSELFQLAFDYESKAFEALGNTNRNT